MILIILIINTIVLAAWLKYLRHLDDFVADKKNKYTLLQFVIFGGIFSVILTLIMSPIWEAFLFYITGRYSDENTFVHHVLIVGPVEELSKFLVFITLAGISKSIKEPRDGILQAVSVALGFSIIENFIYAYVDGVYVLIIRSFLNIIGHMSYGAIWGLAWAAYIYTSNTKYKTPDRYAIIPLFAFAAFFHGIYNSFIVIGYPTLSILINVFTMGIFFLIYNYVKENSPYKEFKLREYKKAIPVLKRGLEKHPNSFVLNKRLGVFNIYSKSYSKAGRYLNKARKIKPKNSAARFYYGVSKYMDGDTSKGLKHMTNAVEALPVNMREKMVATINNVVSTKSDRQELLDRIKISTGMSNTIEKRFKAQRRTGSYYPPSKAQKSSTTARRRIARVMAEREDIIRKKN